MARPQICVHGHFSHAPEGHPLSERYDPGTSSLTLPTIADACYAPNADFGNFRRISFSVNTVVLAWLAANRPNAYRKITEADDATGAAMATPYHDQIFPLVHSTRTRQTEIQWGLAAFEHHYGRRARGFWLPHMAVDHAALLLLAEHGVEYVVLSGGQLQDHPNHGGGPYTVSLPEGQKMTVFARNTALSDDIAFRLNSLGGADHWVRGEVRSRLRGAPSEILVTATSGEVYGHHATDGHYFLGQLVNHSLADADLDLTTLAHYYDPEAAYPQAYLIEESSWHLAPGIAWAGTGWHRALRRVVGQLLGTVEGHYREAVGPAAWRLRDAYAPVLLGTQPAADCFGQHAPGLSLAAQATAQTLLAAQDLLLWASSEHIASAGSFDDAAPRAITARALVAARMMERAVGSAGTLDRLSASLSEIETIGPEKVAELWRAYNLG